MSENKNSEKQFILEYLDLKFEKGYSWEKDPVKQKDRYEGKVTFVNGRRERFILEANEELSLSILNIVKDKIAENVSILVENITKCIGHKN